MDPRFQLSINEEVSQSWLKAVAQVVTSHVFGSGICHLHSGEMI